MKYKDLEYAEFSKTRVYFHKTDIVIIKVYADRFYSRLFCIQQLEYTPNKSLTGTSWLNLQNFIFLNV